MTNPLLKKHVDELREMWQSRALRESSGKLHRVMVAVMSYEYSSAMSILLKATFPGFTDIQRPFLCSYATIIQSGKVVADMIDVDGTKKTVAVYESKDKFVAAVRELADKLKLTDAERDEMFTVLQRWVVKDMRIGPHGERLAS
jgi:hypothetical protein